eukprot:TRINITY_DN1333_c0_g1_i4.p1 TRINITY_DN1333_c0_g1~~TRINITY_DN1333_c0_g1_i4.p1  ORF type:complete len:340 (+),score=64.90 TRINITY_DN1333_c0_g1_i4:172-1191(+)
MAVTDTGKLHALVSSVRGKRTHGATSKKTSSDIKALVQGTRLCKFYLTGDCERGTHCSFAHGQVELQQVPDLKKTRLCSRFQLVGRCRQGAECKFAHGADELRQIRNTSDDEPELRGEEDVCPSSKGMKSTLPTLAAYVRAGMMSDTSSVESAASDVGDGTTCAAADTSYANSYWLQQQQQLQAYLQDELIPMMQLRLQLLMHQRLQLIMKEKAQPLSHRSRAPLGADTLTKDTFSDFSFKKAPSLDTLSGSEGRTDSEEDEDTRRQPHSGMNCQRPQGFLRSDTWLVTVRNTFIHASGLLSFCASELLVHGNPQTKEADAAPKRSKSVPAFMKYGHAT